MADYNPGDPVDVRATVEGGWFPGVVASVDPRFWRVTLDDPKPTQDQWAGTAARYGGNQPVNTVNVYRKQGSELAGNNQHIRHRA